MIHSMMQKREFVAFGDAPSRACPRELPAPPSLPGGGRFSPREEGFHARLDDPARLSLGVVAAPRHALPFHLAPSL